MTASANYSSSAGPGRNGPPRRRPSTAAAGRWATTTTSLPRGRSTTSRWLLRTLSWVQVPGGTYRVNRPLGHTAGGGRIGFAATGAGVRVIPGELRKLPLLREVTDHGVLEELAGRFAQREYAPGELIAEAGTAADRLFLIAHGKAGKVAPGKYDTGAVTGILASGAHFGADALAAPRAEWSCSLRALTSCTVLTLPRREFEEVAGRCEALLGRPARPSGLPRQRRGPQGEGGAGTGIASGHAGEPSPPGTSVADELAPREYELSVARTVLRVHSRIADLCHEPMQQVGQQLRPAVETLRERQEHELVNNRDFGLLHNADPGQRIHPRTGPPTPDDLDELISRRRETQFLLAHPRTITAIGRECAGRGIHPQGTELDGRRVRAWRGIPLLPCDKIPITPENTSPVLALRTGEADQGVVGLRRTGIPDEVEPGLDVRFLGLDGKTVLSYLVSTYFSAAVLVPDALGILEGVEIGAGDR